MGSLLMWPVAGALALKFKVKFEDTAATAVYGIIAILFISGLFGSFLTGFWIVLAIAGISFCYVIYSFIRNRTESKALIMTSGFIASLLLLVYFALLSHDRGVQGLDELSQWQYSVKSYYYFNAYEKPGKYRYFFYPPALTLWQYLGSKLWMTCSETISFISFFVMEMVTMLQLFRNVQRTKNDRKSRIATIMLVLIVLFFPILGTTGAYSMIIPDALIGLEAFYVLINCYYHHLETGKRIYQINMILGLSMMALTKNGSFLLGLILAGFLSALEQKSRNSWRKASLSYLLAFLIPWLLWRIHGLMDGTMSGKSTLVMSTAILLWLPVINVLYRLWTSRDKRKRIVMFCLVALGILASAAYSVMKSGYGYTKGMVYRYLKAMFDTETFRVGFLVPISFAVFTVIILVVYKERHRLIGLISCGNKIEKSDKQDINAKELILQGRIFKLAIVSTVVYVYALLIDFIVTIGPANGGSAGLYLPSLDRYMDPVIVLMAGVLIFIFLELGKTEEEKVSVIIAIALFCSVNVGYLVSSIFYKPEPFQYWAIPHAGITLTEEDTVYFIDQNRRNTTDYNATAFYYYVFPAISNTELSNYHEDEDWDEPLISVEKMEDFMDDYKYVYINTLDDVEAFREQYGSLFEDPEEIDECTFFVREDDGGAMKLCLVGE